MRLDGIHMAAVIPDGAPIAIIMQNIVDGTVERLLVQVGQLQLPGVAVALGLSGIRVVVAENGQHKQRHAVKDGLVLAEQAAVCDEQTESPMAQDVLLGQPGADEHVGRQLGQLLAGIARPRPQHVLLRQARKDRDKQLAQLRRQPCRTNRGAHREVNNAVGRRLHKPGQLNVQLAKIDSGAAAVQAGHLRHIGQVGARVAHARVWILQNERNVTAQHIGMRHILAEMMAQQAMHTLHAELKGSNGLVQATHSEWWKGGEGEGMVENGRERKREAELDSLWPLSII